MTTTEPPQSPERLSGIDLLAFWTWLTERTTVRYLRGGSVAHLLLPNDLETHPYAHADCGRHPGWPDTWLGTGSQDEYERAADLPVCKPCIKPNLAAWRYLQKQTPVQDEGTP